MLKSIGNGFLFGLGFCVASTAYILLADFVSNEYFGNSNQSDQYTALKQEGEYSILNKSHRIKIDSLGSRSLYIVGEIELKRELTKPTIEIVATLRNEAGGFTDKCWEYVEPENRERFSFKIHCSDISDEEQFQSYTLELAYHESL